MRNLGMQYCYSYEEQWQPKDILVVFRMYQLNFTAPKDWVYRKYWEESKVHFVETNFPHSEKGRLAIEQFRIQAAFLHQLGMGAVFHYIPFGENEDAVGELAASQSVGDEKGYSPLGDQVIFLVQLIFNLGIQGRRGLVQDLRLAGPVQGACDGNLRLCGLSPQNTDMPVIPKQPGKGPWPSA